MRNKNPPCTPLLQRGGDSYLPDEAEIIERIQESPTIFTLRLRFTDTSRHQTYRFMPGQFNMVYLYGVGEVAISIVSDPEKQDEFSHTIRTVGQVTNAIAKLQAGDCVGIRGPFGRGWPMEAAKGKDVVVITGGLGCAPLISVITYLTQRLHHYGHLKILQGVKYSRDFIFQERYKQWDQLPKTEIFIAADKVDTAWPWRIGHVTDTIDILTLNPENTVVMMCGPEIMMHIATQALLKKNIAENNIYLSMERNMVCAVGHCGHCQYGGLFICKNGPIFPYSEVKNLFMVEGF